MTYYSMIALTPTDEAWIPGYLGPTNALVAKHGGTYLARTASHEQIEGEPAEEPVAVRILVSWPSREAALAFMSDPDYAPLFAARTAGSKSFHYLVEGKDDFA